MEQHTEKRFKYTTWSIVNMPDLNPNEKIALAFVNAATPIGGISTGQLQRYLGVSTPTMHRILKSLVNQKEIQHGQKMGIWIVTETEKLF